MSSGKWVFVTGGSRGIGRGVVELLSDAGYDVVFTYKSSQAEAADLCSAATPGRGKRKGIACDASHAQEVFAVAEQLVNERGSPYAVINNAGVARDKLFISTELDDWNSVVETNLSSAFLTTRAFLPHMLPKQDGCIVHMSSVTAIRGNIGQTSYASTKAAVLGLTRSLAHEIGRFNVRVNAIAPGLIMTDMTQQIPEGELKRFLRQVALRRIGEVQDVALLVEFLLGPGGRYLTGQTFVVDGGLSA